ncbi:MAG: BREX-1 system adenine-specific DNA-methyltransferase PglX, partial [Deltaproteobacteria bacterium]|nr:BREX-1 system adenine-specific DNA-methyltransferase PglX [Deltaproteobacteria bacterium]
MNRNKLKAYAPQARRDFIKAVTDRAAFYGLTKNKIEPITEQGDVAIIAGKPFPRNVAKKRKRWKERIRLEGFEQVMEAMAYTWFNRFVAIRFMELHGYLEHGYRVLSTTDYTPVEHPGREPGSTGQANSTKKSTTVSGVPEILLYAEHVDLPGLNREKVVELKLAGNRDEELYRMLLIAQCNALHKAMPFLFEWIGDATELLLPENLLHSDSLIRKLVNEILEEEWEEVEIIGWLYQFYISEKKDQVIGKVVKSEDIPAATQLFTPNWIVKYMVQNTLGRQWLSTYPNSPLKQQMEYYIEPAEQTPEVQEQLKSITPESLNPEELTLLDPACGSGHILVEAYNLLKAIYQERGYRAKDIPRLILEKNLYGLEIDDRAAQLAAFALMMKARADDRRIFNNGTKPHVLAIQESKGMDAEKITEALNAPIVKGDPLPREMLFEEMDDARAPLFSRKNLSVKGEISQDDMAQLIQLFEHGKTFGSLIRVPEDLHEKLVAIADRVEDVLAYGEMFGKAAAEALRPIVEQAGVLCGKYNAVVANPPYMGGKGMNGRLSAWAKDNYPDSKSDLFAMFIERGLEMVPKGAYSAMVTMQSWMFLSSYEKLRQGLLSQTSIECMSHMANMVMGIAFGTAATVWRNAVDLGSKGAFCYVEYEDIGESNKPVAFPPVNERNKAALKSSLPTAHCPLPTGFYRASAANFRKIPGSPIAYWVSDSFRQIFATEKPLGKEIEAKQGLATGDNDRFLRYCWEVSYAKVSFSCLDIEECRNDGKKWFPINKGGSFRKWYGNIEFLISFDKTNRAILKTMGNHLPSENKYLLPSISWSDVTSATNSFRYFPAGFLFDATGHSAFPTTEKEKSILTCYCNNKFVNAMTKILNPTMHFHVGYF